ncbi:hypothetical protein TNCV_3843261 [Trichonephila clavipes]|nr:hypothetical protein TNCV_3843261 [Trichonephila clavipes]
MNALAYIDVLRHNLLDSAKKLSMENTFIFQQDNGANSYQVINPIVTKTWLLYHAPRRLEIPPQSPDLNPTENLRMHLDTEVWKKKCHSFTYPKTDDLVPLFPATFLEENRNLDVPDIYFRDTEDQNCGTKDSNWYHVTSNSKDGSAVESPDNPLNDCTFTNSISSISSDVLSDPNDASNVLPRVSRYGRVTHQGTRETRP